MQSHYVRDGDWSPPAAMEVAMTEAIPNKWGDKDPSREELKCQMNRWKRQHRQLKRQKSEQRGDNQRDERRCWCLRLHGRQLHWFVSLPRQARARNASFLHFKGQCHSFRHLALKLHLSSPTKAINCQAWLIPLLLCPSPLVSSSGFSYHLIPARARPTYLVSQTPVFAKLSSIT